VRFIFQHAEELAPGGARELVAAGVMEGVDFVYGCHLWSPLAYGKVAVMPGDWMAAADFFRVTISGRGGHAGLPHTAVDVIAAASEFVGSVQHIVSRRIDPLQPAVVTIGSFHAGDAPNVLSSQAVLSGTTRSFAPDVRERLPKLLAEIGEGVCAAHGASLSLEYTWGYKPVVNEPRDGARALGRARRAGRARPAHGRRRLLRLPGRGAGLLRVHRRRR